MLFAKTHEWVAVADDGGQKIATVGISAFAVEALTDLVFIELPKVGRQVKAGESFCEVESVKAVSDVYAPVTGEVVAVNDSAPRQPRDPQHRSLRRRLDRQDQASPTKPSLEQPDGLTPRTRSSARKKGTS